MILRFMASQKGSITLEYVLVSLFTLVVTIAMLAYLKVSFEKKIETIADELGVKFEPLAIPFLN